MQGARAVQKSIIDEFPITDISVSIVWINMLPDDSDVSAKGATEIICHPSVSQFYDPNRLLGNAIAESIGWKGKVAWDIYLFYAAGAEWINKPPLPTAWMHQLSEGWADREHFYEGDDLAYQLFKTSKNLLSTQKKKSPKHDFE